MDPFAKSNAEKAAKEKRHNEAAAKGELDSQIQGRIRAARELREKMSRPDPAYKPKYPMFNK